MMYAKWMMESLSLFPLFSLWPNIRSRVQSSRVIFFFLQGWPRQVIPPGPLHDITVFLCEPLRHTTSFSHSVGFSSPSVTKTASLRKYARRTVFSVNCLKSKNEGRA
ncbi:hypothetical protein F4678DRAFT_446249 [Xylaria arbuscula]|nr:hypothetical protein F4678DRAFT_446249 [Xylaria arbuscula]